MKIHLGKYGEIKNMNILITGGTGYIGKSLISGLKENNLLIISRKKNIESLYNEHYITLGNSNFHDRLNNFQPEVIIHAAGYTTNDEDHKSLDQLIDSNVKFGLQMLNLMSNSKIKLFINLGSALEYYSNKLEPTNIYAASKSAFHPILHYYSQLYNFKVLNLFLNNIYGGIFSPKKKVLDYIISSLNSINPIDMTPGKQKIDLLHISDLIKLIQRILSSPFKDFYPSQGYIVGHGKEINLIELATLISKLSNKTPNINWGGRNYRIREKMGTKTDNELLFKHFHWQPQVDLKEGLTNYLNIKQC